MSKNYKPVQCNKEEFLSKLIVFILAVIGAFQVVRVSAEETLQDAEGEVKLIVSFGLFEQTGSETLSGSIKVNFEDLFEKENLNLYTSENKKVNLKAAPELSYSITKIKLDAEKQKTNELTATILSLTWNSDRFERYLNLNFGWQEIDTTKIAGEETSDGHTVYIWNPGIAIPLEKNLKLSWDYQLSLENPISNKTQHKSVVRIVYEISF